MGAHTGAPAPPTRRQAGERQPMSDRRYYVTLVVIAVTVLSICGIVANLIITLHKG
jgi:hypothetical protein